MDDRELILAARSGDLPAFSELVRRYQAKVRASLAVRMNHVHDAEDLAQDLIQPAGKPPGAALPARQGYGPRLPRATLPSGRPRTWSSRR